MVAQHYYVYCLIDPRTASIFYVGMTLHPRTRLRNHINTAKIGMRTPCYGVVREIIAAGYKPQLEILETFTFDTIPFDMQCVNIAEARWIKQLEREGQPLTNVLGSAIRSRSARKVSL